VTEARTRGGWLVGVSRSIERHPGAVTFALFALALVPRLVVALRWAHEPVWDGVYYHFGAQRIAEGTGYGELVRSQGDQVFHPWCHYPVGYSGFLAFFYRLFGDAASVATTANALVGAATVSCVHRLGLGFLSPWRALVAGLCCALHPGLVLYAGLLMTEPLAALGVLLGPLVFVELGRRPKLAAAVAGFVLGLATLVRPQSILSAPVMALLPARASLGLRAAIACIATVTAFVTVSPWTLRNCTTMDGCAFVSTNAGWNLAIGSSPRATGRFEPLQASDGCTIVTGQVQQDRCWKERGLAWIREDPARWLALAPKKLSYTFDHQSFAVGYLAQSDPSAWPEERRAWWRGLLTVAQYALLGVAALAAVPRPDPGKGMSARSITIALAAGLYLDGLTKIPRRAWPIAIFAVVAALLPPFVRHARGLVGYLLVTLAGVVVVHAVFFGEDRYQIVVTPALCLLAASALRPRSELAVD
jgi:hypothetical protein